MSDENRYIEPYNCLLLTAEIDHDVPNADVLGTTATQIKATHRKISSWSERFENGEKTHRTYDFIDFILFYFIFCDWL